MPYQPVPYQDIVVQLDPTDHYEKTLGYGWENRVIEACGVLPEFMVGVAETIAKNMEDAYQYFGGWRTGEGATIRDQCFCFPGDPAQPPLFCATHGPESVYIYPHSVVAQTIDGKLTKWTRMD